MAEPLVLASVTIDESGVVAGAAAAKTAVTGMQEGFTATSEATAAADTSIRDFGEHLVSTTRLARLLAHHIGVMALAIGAVGLVHSLLEGSEAVRDFTSGLSEYVDTALRGISATDEMDKKFAALAKDAGIKGSAAQIREDNKKAQDAVHALQEQGAPSKWHLFLVGLQDIAHFSDAVANNIGQAHDHLSEVQSDIDRIKAKSTFIGPEAPAGYGTAEIQERERAAKAAVDLQKQLRHNLLEVVNEYNRDVEKAQHDADIKSEKEAREAHRSALAETRQMQQESAKEEKEMNARLHNLYFQNMNFAQQFITSLEDVNSQTSLTSFGVETMNNALTATGDALGAAAAGAATSGKAVLNSVLTGIAKEASVKAIFELAEGFAALGKTWGVPNPSAVAHFQAAGEYGAVAALAGLGARATGGAGGGPGGGRSFGGGTSASLAPASSQRNTSLIVNVDGNVIGNEAWLRGAVIDIQRQLLDGAGGGSF